MTAQSNPPNPQPAAGRPRRRWLPIAAIALAAALTGAAATTAISHGPPWGGGWHGPGFMRGPLSPAQIEDRVDRGIRHAAIELDATPEQLEKLRAIAKGAVKDLLPMREKGQAAHARVTELLTQPKIDRAAIEAFRAEQLGAGRCGEQALRPGGRRRGRGADARAAPEGARVAAMAPGLLAPLASRVG